MRYFFPETKVFLDALTDLNNFIWPTSAALWNLRYEVAGFRGAVPTHSEADLEARFLRGSGIPSADLVASCITTSWEEQQEQLARYALIVAIAIYEGWTAELLLRFGATSLSKQFQFPSKGYSSLRAADGIKEALTRLTQKPSPVMAKVFGSALESQRHYALSHIDELLLTFRTFKEVRNAVSHFGGQASKWTADWHNEYVALTAANLGMPVPELAPVTAGARVAISLKGVIGLLNAIHRIVMTLDAELAQTSTGEKAFVERWRRRYVDVPVVSPKATKRTSRIRSRIHNMQMPKPATTSVLEPISISNKLIKIP